MDIAGKFKEIREEMEKHRDSKEYSMALQYLDEAEKWTTQHQSNTTAGLPQDPHKHESQLHEDKKEDPHDKQHDKPGADPKGKAQPAHQGR